MTSILCFFNTFSRLEATGPALSVSLHFFREKFPEEPVTPKAHVASALEIWHVIARWAGARTDTCSRQHAQSPWAWHQKQQTKNRHAYERALPNNSNMHELSWIKKSKMKTYVVCRHCILYIYLTHYMTLNKHYRVVNYTQVNSDSCIFTHR